MNKITLFLVASVFAVAGKPVFSAEESFDKRKAEVLSQLDQRIQKLQENRTCMAAAGNRGALKKCHETMKTWREGKKHEMMESKHTHMEEHSGT